MAQIVVDISDFQVSNDPAAELITYSLGSCIGGRVSRTMRLDVATGQVTIGNHKMKQVEI